MTFAGMMHQIKIFFVYCNSIVKEIEQLFRAWFYCFIDLEYGCKFV